MNEDGAYRTYGMPPVLLEDGQGIGLSPGKTNTVLHICNSYLDVGLNIMHGSALLGNWYGMNACLMLRRRTFKTPSVSST